MKNILAIDYKKMALTKSKVILEIIAGECGRALSSRGMEKWFRAVLTKTRNMCSEQLIRKRLKKFGNLNDTLILEKQFC
jgi:hypothetical protein